MQFNKVLTVIIVLILVFVIIKFTGTERYDLLYTDKNSITKYDQIVNNYNNIKPNQISQSQIQTLQDQIASLSNSTNNQTIKEKLLALMDKSDSLKKLHQVSTCLDMINKLDKLTVNNISTTWLDENKNPNCSTQVKIMKNKIISINKQYQQYELYKSIYLDGLQSCDKIEDIYNSIIAFNKQVEDFWPNNCDISMPKINLQNIGTNLKNIYSWDTVDSLVDKIKIIKQWDGSWQTINETANSISNTFKNRRWKIN